MTERHVLAVIHGATFGGPCNEIQTLAEDLRSRDYRFTVLLPDEPGSARDRLTRAGIDVISAPMTRLRRRRSPVFWLLFPLRFLRDVWRLVRVVRSRGVDIVHGYGINLQAAFAAKFTRRPLVWSLIDIGAPSAVRSIVAALVRRMADVVLLDGRSMADRYPDVDRGPAKTSSYFPPVDLDRFPPRTATATAMVTVGTVANINPDKNLDLLVAAAEVLLARGQSVRFVVTGARHATHHELADRLESRASRLPAGRFVFAGETDDVPAALGALDVFVVTSRSEGTTTTAIEAMAAGLPVVATAVGGLAEVVDHGKTGLLLPSDDLDALVAAIERLVGDPELRAVMGAEGRSRAEREFGKAEFVRLLERAYVSAAGNARL